MRGVAAGLIGPNSASDGATSGGAGHGSLKGRGRAIAIATCLAGSAAPALGQTATTPTVTTGQPAEPSFGPQATATIKKLVADGYDIKTGFIDPNGGAYLALQKATSAYLCHSNPNPTCEKLN